MKKKQAGAARNRWIAPVLLSAFASTLFAQSNARKSVPPQASAWEPKKLSDGQPDIEGIWTTVYYGMGCLTNPTNGDVNCVPPPGPRPAAGTANAGVPPPPDASGRSSGQRGNGNPPDIVSSEAAHEKDAHSEPQSTGGHRPHNAPSRIIDTPNYDIPYTQAALAHQQDLFAHYYTPIRYGDIDPQQRCWPLGALRQFTWHDVQIEQFPGYIVMIYEGAEQYRIIYLDDRPHIGQDLKLWFGDSRGHWEGNTLVVDTTSNNAKGRLSRAGDFSSNNVHYIERFKFSDGDHFRYEVTFTDPTVYTRPWTFALDEHRAFFAGDGGTPEGPVTADSQAKYENWEEACHEGLIPGGNDIPGLPPEPPSNSEN
ncbi:hypothetical protein ACPOL_2562 [Acidisarcina polymorpha]|uniref:Uncharacterized protein n=1 Tax=Acidisarcina polymorpha TaxID=2211140 RepID=A0A2Z5FYI8_9BACT|nr:hypothetical protein [Acidisarcina polymorpha]AXC11882.1 hypothetical protein ACPOL_2562 [Acidisarcina polymorpha]